jgi:hypothetical protein
LRREHVWERQLGVRITCSFTLVAIAKELYLNWFISKSIFSEKAHNLVQAVAGWPVLVEQIAGEEDKVYL